jgi:hypothetical protein
MHKPTFCAVKIANSASVIITDNMVTEVTTSFGAAAIFFAGNIPHPGPSGGPFHNILIANNIVRNYASGAGIEIHGDTRGTSLRHEIVGNIVDGATSGIQLDGALNVLIADNVICNSTGNTNYDGGIRMVRMVASSPDQGEVTIRGCMFINNGAYAIFADGNYDNSGLRLSVSDCLFYSSNLAPLLCLTHIRLGSSVASIVQADIRDNRLRGNPQALIITGNPDKLWLYDNQAETSTISIGTPVNGLLHGGNSWDMGMAGWTISLSNFGSHTAPINVTGANPGDTVVVGYDGFPAGILGGGVVTAAGLAQVTLFNTSAAFGSTAGNVRVAVSRHV